VAATGAPPVFSLCLATDAGALVMGGQVPETLNTGGGARVNQEDNTGGETLNTGGGPRVTPGDNTAGETLNTGGEPRITWRDNTGGGPRVAPGDNTGGETLSTGGGPRVILRDNTGGVQWVPTVGPPGDYSVAPLDLKVLCSY